MDRVRVRNNATSPRSAKTSATPFDQPYSLLPTPKRSEFDVEDPTWPFPSPSDSPLFRGFERPSFSRIAILTFLCLVTYPVFYVLTLVANDRSLFMVRAIVSVWCWGGGFALGFVLLKIGAQHLEGATWATVIHMSRGGGGMKLLDLARSSGDPKSPWSALCMFWCWFWNREAVGRHSRKSYERPWSLFLAFFVILAILAPSLPFLFGRIMVIETFVRNQRKAYREVLIAGDLSQEDLSRMEDQIVMQDQGLMRIWPVSPYGGSTSDTTEFVYGNDTVYFSQPRLSQFVPGGSGAGAFSQTVTIGPKGTPTDNLVSTGKNVSRNDVDVVLRYPQWGMRIHCERLPDPRVNLVPLSNQTLTYVFIPRDFLRDLFGVYGMGLPERYMESPWFMLGANDSIPSNIDPSTIAWIDQFPNDGASVSILPTYPEENSDQEWTTPEETWDQGWTTVETVLLRLDTDSTPSGYFPVHSKTSSFTTNLEETSVGNDAAVCVQKYEPWIIETYNTSIVSPSALRIVGRGNDSTSLWPSGSIQGAPIANTRNLNTTGKNRVFSYAHENTIGGIMVTNNDWILGTYRPTPLAVSFTNGTGSEGYTELSPDRLAIIRARAGAANSLPYLVGSGPVVAQVYSDETLAYVTFNPWQLIGLPMLLWILGVIGELFVPTLPLNIPRRDFGVYSWLALFQSQELRFEEAGNLKEHMSLNKLEDKFSDKRVEFVV